MASLQAAVKRGNLPEVRRLVNAGANINARHDELTPLMYAASNGHANVIRYLLSKGANARARQSTNNPRTALFYAAEKGNINSVRALLRHSNLNVQDGNGRTALTTAASLGYNNITRMLVRAGARTNNMTLEYLVNNEPNTRKLLAASLIRRTMAKKKLTNTVRRKLALRKTHAMRGQLAFVPVREGRNTVVGLPRNIRNRIAEMMLKRA